MLYENKKYLIINVYLFIVYLKMDILLCLMTGLSFAAFYHCLFSFTWHFLGKLYNIDTGDSRVSSVYSIIQFRQANQK